VQCNTGDVIIFPSWLKHFVRENKTDQERIVMTINIK
jgi:ectoine hydroxylase-related dioxygenase (phytanoyl-CoA dioxygenase family)